MSGVGQAVFMNQRSFGAPPGQEAFTTPGTFTWVAPAGVTSVSVVVVGAGEICAGNLAYKNNITVSPGCSYTVVVASTATKNTGSYFLSTGTVLAKNRNSSAPKRVGDGGGCGGGGFFSGGGAGGYSGNGGGCTASVNSGSNGAAGSGGGGGSGAEAGAFYNCPCGFDYTGAGGGGVGILGQGANGAGGTSSFTTTFPCSVPNVAVYATGGEGGSGGGAGGSASYTGYLTRSLGNGGAFGGGGNFFAPATSAGQGAVRIIWPGTTRSFPSTCTGNL